MKHMLVAAALLVACGPKSPPPAPPPPPNPTPTPAPEDAAVPTQCKGDAPGPGYVCVQECGPPVSHPGDPPPGYSWLSPADAENRKKFGCPICLPPETRIATPDGDRAIRELAVGDPIVTLDAAGQRVVARVAYAASSPVSHGHEMARVTLADGRVVIGSLGHPDVTGRGLGALHAGDLLDGTRVSAVAVVPYAGERTWDVLPTGATGLYVADGVVLRSTFFGKS